MVSGGDIEDWNEQITAWMGAVNWVPHHIAGLIACMAAFLLIQSVRGKTTRVHIAVAIIIGFSLASASGLTIYVTIVFALFWAVWMLYLLIAQKEYRTVGIMIFAGIVSLVLAGPYLRDLMYGEL